MFKNLFKKKPGGTLVGNLFRTASKQIPIVGQFLGNGDNRIEVGETKTNAELGRLGYLSGKGSKENPIELEEVTVGGSRKSSSIKDVGFKDKTFGGKLFNAIRGELGAASEQIQPKVGVATETMIIGVLGVVAVAFIMKK